MQSPASRKVASSLYRRFPSAVIALTWVMRLAVGGLFLFSGFTKGIDVWGTIFKFQEYFGVWGYEVWTGLNVAGVFLLCLAEFLAGFFLVFGCFRRAAPVLALVIMIFMLPLSFWLAVANPISDCGCFGDAWKISNWATFYKNVLLTLGAVWLIVFNLKAPALIKPYLQWLGTLAAGSYILAVSWVGYYYQPLIDFRPYKIGTPLVENEEESDPTEDEDQYLRFVYEKDGIRKEFTIDDNLPDEDVGWNFVERYYDIPGEGAVAALQPDLSNESPKHLRFFSEDGMEDMTAEVIGDGRQLILMIPVISEVSAAKTWKINSFYDWAKDHDIDMLATMGGNPNEIQAWKEISLAQYPIYTSDDTSIKEVVRGNPGIVYIEDGIIKWKSSLESINIDDFQDPAVTSDPMNFARDNRKILLSLTWIFFGITVLLIVFSYSPQLVRLMLHAKEKTLRKKRRTNNQDNDAKQS